MHKWTVPDQLDKYKWRCQGALIAWRKVTKQAIEERMPCWRQCLMQTFKGQAEVSQRWETKAL